MAEIIHPLCLIVGIAAASGITLILLAIALNIIEA
jgi:hypothetical protein